MPSPQAQKALESITVFTRRIVIKSLHFVEAFQRDDMAAMKKQAKTLAELGLSLNGSESLNDLQDAGDTE